jgi:hypothetical protein
VQDFEPGDIVLVLDVRFAGVWKGRMANINDPVLGIDADEGKTFAVVSEEEVQTIAGIKIRGELLGVSATDMAGEEGRIEVEVKARVRTAIRESLHLCGEVS